MNIAYSTELICFLILSAVIVSGSLAVVLLENIVYSAFLLGGVFILPNWAEFFEFVGRVPYPKIGQYLFFILV